MRCLFTLVLSTLLLAACTHQPPPPDWLLTARSAGEQHARRSDHRGEHPTDGQPRDEDEGRAQHVRASAGPAHFGEVEVGVVGVVSGALHVEHRRARVAGGLGQLGHGRPR